MDTVAIKQELIELIKSETEKGVSEKEIEKCMLAISKSQLEPASKKSRFFHLALLVLVGSIATAGLIRITGVGRKGFRTYMKSLAKSASESVCLVDAYAWSQEVCRPLADCSMCNGLDEAPVRANISKLEFLEKHAYSGRPLLVTNATESWTAFDTFSFSYFKRIYKELDSESENSEDAFFPYKTNFEDLNHFLSMSKKREKKMKWYVGWSNGNTKIMNELRNHYQRPSFLPDGSESSQIDWIFMGGSGPGAQIHIDSVSRPSWQAQISGKKTWFLYPPPECEHVCKPFNITMNKGDIVVVDTNVWYHSTYIHPGEISITIGSEYD